MDARWRELQRQVVVTRRAGRRVFSVDLRQAAAGAAVEARAHGQSVWRSAQRLGVGVQALQSWIVAHSGRAGFRKVEVVRADAPVAARHAGLAVVLPTGTRVEGLDLEDVVRLLRVTG